MKSPNYIEKKLRNIFPNKIYGTLKEIQEEWPSLYSDIKEAAKRADLSSRDFLTELGYYRKTQVANTLNDNELRLFIIKEMNQHFPTRQFGNLIEIKHKYSNLYDAIVKLSIRQNLTPKILIKNLGYKRGQRRQPNANQMGYDLEKMTFIQNDFDITYAFWGKFLDLSRERIRQIINGDIANIVIWNQFTVTNQDFDLIRTILIANRTNYYSNQKVSFMLLTNLKKVIKEDVKPPVKMILLIRNKEKVAFSYDLTEVGKYRSELEMMGYFHFVPEKLKEAWSFANLIKDSISQDNNYRINRAIYDKLEQLRKSSILDSLDDYFGFFGINLKHSYLDERLISADHYYKRLAPYINDKGIIKLPINEDYRYFANVASRNKMSIGDYLESLGYKYIRNKDSYGEQIKDTLLKRRLSNQRIFIDTKDPFYSQLHAYISRNSNKGMNSFILDNYGLKRVLAKELMASDNPYPFWLDLEDFKNLDETQVQVIISRYLDENDTLVISFNSKLYRQLSIFATSINRFPLSLLKDWGIHYEVVTDSGELDSKVRILEELEGIDSLLNKVTLTTEKANRSKQLVSLLKRLYDNQCQFCSPDTGIPPIQMSTGLNYIEMHHIKPISDFSDDGNDDSDKMIDSYRNCVIVCPHHHKVLHYHQGGYPSLQMIGDDLYFINRQDSNNKILIRTNYHLVEIQK